MFAREENRGDEGPTQQREKVVGARTRVAASGPLLSVGSRASDAKPISQTDERAPPGGAGLQLGRTEISLDVPASWIQPRRVYKFSFFLSLSFLSSFSFYFESQI
jgi:hypothetical protein